MGSDRAKKAEVETEVNKFMRGLRRRNAYQVEFQQAVEEVVEDLMPLVLESRELRKAQILERMTEPDRIITFRVTWVDDEGNTRANRAWRVQFNHAIGPYKGGLRFHPSVNESILKFLGFEQTFKNSLTGMPMGGAKGGSNFNPKGKSDGEVMRFCHAMMQELHKYIGKDRDIPAGDIGVGAREIGFLYGKYLALTDEFRGVLTGKGCEFGGSAGRVEATGYGCVYFCENMLGRVDDSLEGKAVVVSGSGNVALHAVEKASELGARVVTVSDSDGFVFDKEGIGGEKLEFLKQLKLEERGRVSEYAEKYSGVEFHDGERPWGVACDVAMPCATQNEIDDRDAAELLKNGVRVVCEGANMPSTSEAVRRFRRERILYAPGKASNAGGVAVSGLERSQNAQHLSWGREEVDEKLKGIMEEIEARCVEHGEEGKHVDYVKGANVGGFLKVAGAMLGYGAV